MKRRIAAVLLVMFLAAAGCAVSGADAQEDAEQPYLGQVSEEDPSIGYVLVENRNQYGLLPLPAEGEYTKTIRQELADGSEYVNVIHVAPTGFWMEKSNCEGQDCIDEGEVTLENRQERILGNMVICLPHQLMLYLITREEAVSFLSQGR